MNVRIRRPERSSPAPIEIRLVKLAFRPIGRWAAARTLLGRSLDRDAPDKGRLTRRDVARVLSRTWREYDDLAPAAHVERLDSLGSRQNVLLGVFSLAVHRALLAEGITADYAAELVADLAWTVYRQWMALPRAVARVVRREPQKQMDLMLRMFLRYPFGRPGYEWEERSKPDVFQLDIHRCPVRDYFASQGEEKLMRATWCTLDFPLAQVMTEGGRYEREHTLSHGDALCDMRWFATSGTSRLSPVPEVRAPRR